MTALTDQDANYISSVRSTATSLLSASASAAANEAKWNNYFGGATHLGADSFANNDAGLTKDNIQNAKDVMTQFNAWLDEAGQNRRAYLMAVSQI